MVLEWLTLQRHEISFLPQVQSYKSLSPQILVYTCL